jgi:hypothetical protein
VFSLFCSSVFGFSLVSNPEEFFFDDVLVGGYSEQVLIVSTDSVSPVVVSLSASEPFNSWFSFEPVSASVSSSSPVKFKVVVRPSNILIGTYQGYLVVTSLSAGNEVTSSVSSSLAISASVKVTDEQIMQARVDDVVVKNVEVGSPLRVYVKVQNQGNVGVTPFFTLDISDFNRSKILKSGMSGLETILPYSSGALGMDLPLDLPLGVYWAQVTVLLGKDWVLGKRLVKFSVVEKGSLPVEEKVVSNRDVVSLGVSWFVLVVWIFVLVFIIWFIARKRFLRKKLGKRGRNKGGY